MATFLEPIKKIEKIKLNLYLEMLANFSLEGIYIQKKIIIKNFKNIIWSSQKNSHTHFFRAGIMIILVNF